MQKAQSDSPQRWIIVAESPFIPTHGGGEREHLGFVKAAVEAGLLAALVVPTDADPRPSAGRTTWTPSETWWHRPRSSRFLGPLAPTRVEQPSARTWWRRAPCQMIWCSRSRPSPRTLTQ